MSDIVRFNHIAFEQQIDSLTVYPVRVKDVAFEKQLDTLTVYPVRVKQVEFQEEYILPPVIARLKHVEFEKALKIVRTKLWNMFG
jgi:hypothetical protein